MSERQEFGLDRTDRPARADVLLTVADVLAQPVVIAGAPEVIVGGDALDAEVRWAHISDSAGVARLLDGGELLLSTGAGWPDDPFALREFARLCTEPASPASSWSSASRWSGCRMPSPAPAPSSVLR